MSSPIPFLVLATALTLADAQQPPVAKPAVLRELHSLAELQEAFNRDVGRPRIVLLLSPT